MLIFKLSILKNTIDSSTLVAVINNILFLAVFITLLQTFSVVLCLKQVQYEYLVWSDIEIIYFGGLMWSLILMSFKHLNETSSEFRIHKEV